MAHTHSHILLLFTYALLFVFNVIAVYLYHRAYYQMHKTRMIKSVYYLLIAFLIENIYFGLGAIADATHNQVMLDIFLFPLFWSIPKLLLLAALIFFIQSSLAPSAYDDEQCEKCKYLDKCPNPKSEKYRYKTVKRN